jgi:hypothetical protein
MAINLAAKIPSQSPRSFPFGNTTEEDGFVITKASPAVGDDYVPIRIPAGTRVTYVLINNTDLDSGATVTCSVGWVPADGSAGGNAAAFIAAASAILQAATVTHVYLPGDLAVDVSVDANLVVRLGGTFAGWATGGTIRALWRGQGRGAK